MAIYVLEPIASGLDILLRMTFSRASVIVKIRANDVVTAMAVDAT